MHNILLLGAGKTSPYVLSYFAPLLQARQWTLRVGDAQPIPMAKEYSDHPAIDFIQLDVNDTEALRQAVEWADVVMSLLPARLHIGVAQLCATFGRDMLTASYATDEMRALGQAFADKGKTLCMELGLDPGIDHMIAMKVIDEVRAQGYTPIEFEAFTGALIASDTDVANPWRYKFTWSPSQVVRAGTEGAAFLQEKRTKHIPYHQVFRRIETINIPDHGMFEGYANRNSMPYRHIYGLKEVKTIFRGTLRPIGFCRAWNTFVQLGATDTRYTMNKLSGMTHKDFINSFLFYHPTDSVELKLAHYLNLDLHSATFGRLKWLGVFDDTPLDFPQDSATAADLLEHILKKKWTMQKEDKDHILMYERLRYQKNPDAPVHERHAHLSILGENAQRTAIAQSVGLTLAIATRLLLANEAPFVKGIQWPTQRALYIPVLNALAERGIHCYESEQVPD